MPTFRVLPEESPVSIDAQSSMHPVVAQSRALTGTIDVELDENGQPVLDAPYAARLRVPADSIRSGHGLQDREMHRRLDTKRYPDITVDLTDVSASEANRSYHAKARIAVRGQSQEVEGDVTLTVDGDRLVVEGGEAID